MLITIGVKKCILLELDVFLCEVDIFTFALSIESLALYTESSTHYLSVIVFVLISDFSYLIRVELIFCSDLSFCCNIAALISLSARTADISVFFNGTYNAVSYSEFVYA